MQDQNQNIANELAENAARAKTLGLTNSDDFVRKISDRIRGSENIVVTVSKDPTVDELAAALALTRYLEGMQKHVTAIYSGKYPTELKFMQPEGLFDTDTEKLRDFVISLPKNKADHLQYKIEGDDVRIYITPYKTILHEKDFDFATGDYNVNLAIAFGVRTADGLDKALSNYGQILHDTATINISCEAPGRFGEIEWSDTQASSVSEMLAKLIMEMEGGNDATLEESIATPLLAGIVAATSRFSNERTNPRVLELSSKLMSMGADQQLISVHAVDNVIDENIEPEEPIIETPAPAPLDMTRLSVDDVVVMPDIPGVKVDTPKVEHVATDNNTFAIPTLETPATTQGDAANANEILSLDMTASATKEPVAASTKEQNDRMSAAIDAIMAPVETGVENQAASPAEANIESPALPPVEINTENPVLPPVDPSSLGPIPPFENEESQVIDAQNIIIAEAPVIEPANTTAQGTELKPDVAVATAVEPIRDIAGAAGVVTSTNSPTTQDRAAARTEILRGATDNMSDAINAAKQNAYMAGATGHGIVEPQAPAPTSTPPVAPAPSVVQTPTVTTQAVTPAQAPVIQPVATTPTLTAQPAVATPTLNIPTITPTASAAPDDPKDYVKMFEDALDEPLPVETAASAAGLINGVSGVGAIHQDGQMQIPEEQPKEESSAPTTVVGGIRILDTPEEPIAQAIVSTPEIAPPSESVESVAPVASPAPATMPIPPVQPAPVVAPTQTVSTPIAEPTLVPAPTPVVQNPIAPAVTPSPTENTITLPPPPAPAASDGMLPPPEMPPNTLPPVSPTTPAMPGNFMPPMPPAQTVQTANMPNMGANPLPAAPAPQMPNMPNLGQ